MARKNSRRNRRDARAACTAARIFDSATFSWLRVERESRLVSAWTFGWRRDAAGTRRRGRLRYLKPRPRKRIESISEVEKSVKDLVVNFLTQELTRHSLLPGDEF